MPSGRPILSAPRARSGRPPSPIPGRSSTPASMALTRSARQLCDAPAARPSAVTPYAATRRDGAEVSARSSQSGATVERPDAERPAHPFRPAGAERPATFSDPRAVFDPGVGGPHTVGPAIARRSCRAAFCRAAFRRDSSRRCCSTCSG